MGLSRESASARHVFTGMQVESINKLWLRKNTDQLLKAAFLASLLNVRIAATTCFLDIFIFTDIFDFTWRPSNEVRRVLTGELDKNLEFSKNIMRTLANAEVKNCGSLAKNCDSDVLIAAIERLNVRDRLEKIENKHRTVLHLLLEELIKNCKMDIPTAFIYKLKKHVDLSLLLKDCEACVLVTYIESCMDSCVLEELIEYFAGCEKSVRTAAASKLVELKIQEGMQSHEIECFLSKIVSALDDESLLDMSLHATTVLQVKAIKTIKDSFYMHSSVLSQLMPILSSLDEASMVDITLHAKNSEISREVISLLPPGSNRQDLLWRVIHESKHKNTKAYALAHIGDSLDETKLARAAIQASDPEIVQELISLLAQEKNSQDLLWRVIHESKYKSTIAYALAHFIDTSGLTEPVYSQLEKIINEETKAYTSKSGYQIPDGLLHLLTLESIPDGISEEELVSKILVILPKNALSIYHGTRRYCTGEFFSRLHTTAGFYYVAMNRADTGSWVEGYESWGTDSWEYTECGFPVVKRAVEAISDRELLQKINYGAACETARTIAGDILRRT